MSQLLLLTSIPVLALLASAAFGAYVPAGERLKSALQHFAAGVVFAIVAVELIPDLRQRHDPWEMGVSFAIGVVLMLVVRMGAERLENKAFQGYPYGMAAAIGIDLLFDGILLGIGIAAGARAGKLMAAGLGTETLSLGLALTSSFNAKTSISRRVQFLTTCLMAALFSTGTLIASTFFTNAGPRLMVWLLSMGSAALLYLVTEELLVEAHETADTPITTGLFFLGFLIFLVLGMVL